MKEEEDRLVEKTLNPHAEEEEKKVEEEPPAKGAKGK